VKIIAVHQHFIERSSWVDPAKIVDCVIVGNPEEDVDRCLVTWMPNMKALRYAVEKRYKLVICNEPTFWNHFDDIPGRSQPVYHRKTYLYPRA
jgi:hypothetical protein